MSNKSTSLLVLLSFALLFAACASPTSPSNPKEQVEYYEFLVTYIRPEGSVVNPAMWDPGYDSIELNTKVGNMSAPATKISDNEFILRITDKLPTHLRTEKNLPPNSLSIKDPKRWINWGTGRYDGWSYTWALPHTVGDIFKIKNLNTGVEVVLTNLVDNPNHTMEDAKMVQFWVVKGGAVVNSWPY